MKTIRLGDFESHISIEKKDTLNKNLLHNHGDKNFLLIEETLLPFVKDYITHTDYFVCPPSEACKNKEVFEAILQAFFDASLSRSSCVSVIGGGALCDVGSFAASVYMRGIRLHLFPTTLLSMVDASIGGKTAINYKQLKNMIGTFYPAHYIYIYPHFLSSLPQEHLYNGLSEILKAGMLHNPAIVEQFEQHAQELQTPYTHNTHTLWEKIIWDAAEVKMHFVESDFKEQNTTGVARAFLNLGHTFAHAIEAESHLKDNTAWHHGTAVALGLRTALALGLRLKITDSHYHNKIINILDTFSYPKHYPNNFSAQKLISYIKRDKKNTSTDIRLVLQKNMAQTLLQSVSEKEIYKTLVLLGAN